MDYLGASVEDTIAFGDAKVDIPMFEFTSNIE
ncbi:MAG: HAD hydrolase family protein [Eubacteriales bacterium]|nr:HAD hydrolase family protein [Eubacteriales bacterium]